MADKGQKLFISFKLGDLPHQCCSCYLVFEVMVSKSEKVWGIGIGTLTFKLTWFATNSKCCLHFWLQGWPGIQQAYRKIFSCAVITSPHAICFLMHLYLTHGEGCPSSRMGACFLWSCVMKPDFTPPLLAGTQTHPCSCDPGGTPQPTGG